MRFIGFILTMSISLWLAVPQVLAQPAVSDVTVTDVTTSAFSVAWTADEPSTGQLEVFSDSNGLNPVSVTKANRSQNNPPAEDLGVLKMDVSGLSANTTYYLRTVTTAKGGGGTTLYPASPPLLSVSTQTRVARAVMIGPNESPFTNDQLAVDVFQEDGVTPADGALVLLNVAGAGHPVSAFVGEGAVSPRTILDMNNLFDAAAHSSLDFFGGEGGTMTVLGGLLGKTSLPMTMPVDAEMCRVVWSDLTYIILVQDADGDGIPDSSDNCPNVPNSDQADTDGDKVGNACDNCTLIANANQRDTNNDGYGNICDPDLDNNGAVGVSDFGLFKSAFGTSNADADFDGNGAVGVSDFGIFKSYFGKPPGPSGLKP